MRNRMHNRERGQEAEKADVGKKIYSLWQQSPKTSVKVNELVLVALRHARTDLRLP